jgi:prepilin-type N-terminal cleavage/methylation domain-containing protein
MKTRAFTLLETLITLSIFSVVAVSAVLVISNSLQSTRKIRAQVFLYSEAQAAMDQIARLIEQNGIDYESYYAYEGQGDLEAGVWTPDYGQYGQAFFHPGDDGPVNVGPYYDDYAIGGYEAFCEDGSSTYPDDCSSDLPLFDDLDQDTGSHPFDGVSDFGASVTDDSTYWNAFCFESSDCSNDLSLSFSDVLFLISSDGDERQVILKEDFGESTEEYRLSRIQLLGSDSTLDGVVDDWECSSEYTCNESRTGDGGETLAVPDLDDLNTNEGIQEDFMPFTPSSIHFSEFHVLVAPLEDPYRAFAEEKVQIQPYVTIVMTATLSEDYSSNLLGDNVPEITIQRTVSTGVYGDVGSYE